MTTATGTKPTKMEAFKMERGVKYRDAAKTSVIQVRNIDPDQELLPKPSWMKIKLPVCAATAYILCVKKRLARTCTNALTTVRQLLSSWAQFVPVVARSVMLHTVNRYR